MSPYRTALALLLFCLPACPAPFEPSDLAAADLAPAADLAAPLRALRSQDVTVVYPLPKAADVDLLLQAGAVGLYGRLIPVELFAQIPVPLDPRPGARTAATGASGWAGLRLVSLRLDPCFGSRGEIPDAACPNQIRLVFQGVRPIGEVSMSDDGAVHVLYQLSRREVLDAAREIVTLAERSGGYEPAPLWAHPVLQREGLRGPFAEGLKALVLRHLGERRIARLTFFARGDTLLSSWIFGAFERKGASFARVDIATTSTSEQTLRTSLPDGGLFVGSTPTPTNAQDNPLLLIHGPLARAADEQTRARAFGAALRIENPLRHTPDTIDCVGCHVAQAARTCGEDIFGLRSEGHPDRFTGPGDLRQAIRPALSLENVHAASYHGIDLGLNQRTVNESAAVAQHLGALLEGP